MSRHHSQVRAGRAGSALILLSVLLLALAGVVYTAQPVGAASVAPTHIPGSNNDGKWCSDVIPGSVGLENLTASGSDGTLSVAIVRPSVAGGAINPDASFDWTSNIPVLGVVVKDGVDGANFYDYRPSGSSGDEYLTTPGPAFGGTYKNISHINFCYDPGTPLPAQLTIVKTAWPEEGSPSFGFDADSPLSPSAFDLVDPTDRSEVFSGLEAGTYTVSEDLDGLPEGWWFHSVSCWDDDDEWFSEVNEAEAEGVATVTLVAGQAVTCEFVNARPARLTIVKETDPDGGSGFGFTTTNLGGAAFTLDDDGSEVFSDLEAGTYGAAEGTMPEGWQFSAVSCVDAAGAPVPDGDLGAAVSVTLAAGDDVTCTFVNTEIPDEPDPGRIIVRKFTLPEGAPPHSFSFDPSWGGNFSLADGESHDSGLLDAGIYSVAELMPLGEGWSLTAATCNDGSPPGAIGLSPGEMVTCTFVNTFEQVEGPKGSLTIIKVVDGLLNPADATAMFSFDGGGLGSFQLGDGDSQAFSELDPGAYSVVEGALPASADPPSAVAGSVGYEWHFDSVECTATSWSADGTSVTVNLAEGEAAVCTFYNYQEMVAGPELPYTGGGQLVMPLLIGGLWALLMGLALVVWSAMRRADTA